MSTAAFASCFSTPNTFPTAAATASSMAAMQLQPQAPMHHGIVLDWEDVLVPMTLLAHRTGLTNSRAALETASLRLANDAYLQQALVAIEEQTVKLLQTAAAIGPVFLVTERSLRFMEMTCAVFFPRLTSFLQQAGTRMPTTKDTLRPYPIQVIGAPRAFTSPAEYATWRVQIMQGVCLTVASQGLQTSMQQSLARLHSPDAGRFGLIAVTATEQEVQACVMALERSGARFVQPKCVQVAGDQQQPLSLEAFFAQLQTLQSYMATSAAHTNAFSTRLQA